MTRSLKAEDLLELMETLLQAQLETIQEIRRIRTAEGDTDFFGGKPTHRSLSQVDMVCEVLAAADGPLHIGEITRRVRETFGVFTTRESLASAVLRDVKTRNRLVKAGRNTYGITGRDQP